MHFILNLKTQDQHAIYKQVYDTIINRFYSSKMITKKNKHAFYRLVKYR